MAKAEKTSIFLASDMLANGLPKVFEEQISQYAGSGVDVCKPTGDLFRDAVLLRSAHGIITGFANHPLFYSRLGAMLYANKNTAIFYPYSSPIPNTCTDIH